MIHKVQGFCKHCSALVEVELGNVAIEHSSEYKVRMEIIHKPDPINGTPACGGRVIPICVVSEDDVTGRYEETSPLELWAVLYAAGMSYRDIAKLLGIAYYTARRLLDTFVQRRRVGRQSKRHEEQAFAVDIQSVFEENTRFLESTGDTGDDADDDDDDTLDGVPCDGVNDEDGGTLDDGGLQESTAAYSCSPESYHTKEITSYAK